MHAGDRQRRLTEAQAREAGFDVTIEKVDRAIGKANMLGEGVVKVVGETDDRSAACT